MSNRPIPDPVEATFRDLRGAVYAGDGRAAMATIDRRPDLDTLQNVGDGVLLALAQGVTGAPRRAEEHIGALRNRDRDGDEDLAIELARFHQYTDDRRRGRARQWLAESALRPTVPVEAASPGQPDLHGLP